MLNSFLHLADCSFYVVIETSGSDPTHDGEKLHNFLEEAMNSSLVTDGTVATEDSKIKVLFQIIFRISLFISGQRIPQKENSHHSV